MPVRDRMIWGKSNPFSDPRLWNLDVLVRDIRRHGRLPAGVSGGRVFENRRNDLPFKPPGYYKEYDVVATAGDRGKLRLVLGMGGEVYVSGNHYDDFRQVLEMPS